MSCAAPLVDPHGRTVRYLRLSVTDRCDLRCRYCMAETMQFLPRDAVLSLDEMAIIAEAFIGRGIDKIRLTGGEPLVRRDVLDLVRRLGRHLGGGLRELTMTTNGNHLVEHAAALFAAGMRRINVSLDSLDPATFRTITRHGDISRVIAGIGAAQDAGLHVKINMVALRGMNDHEIEGMLGWCVARGHDLSLIETMPLGAIDDDRVDRFVPLNVVFDTLAARFDLVRDAHDSGGPARYWRVRSTTTRLGLISPLTNNFCSGCNRIRLTTEGMLYTCLGHDDHVDLKSIVRSRGLEGIAGALDTILLGKPARHDFDLSAEAPAVARHMSVTGG